MWQRRSIRVVAALGIGMLLTAALVALAGAYAEEPIAFRDPYTGQEDQDVEVSTIHTDLTYVLALAAGFSVTDSRTLMIWDQLVDSNQITTQDATYSNCLGTFPISPTMELVCTNTAETNLFWPFWKKVPATGDGTSCVTSRYGTYEGFFHFPRRSGPDIAALKAWGWGDAKELVGYKGYVWGPSPMASFEKATCFYTETTTIDTGMAPGSLEAFATYLHSLADSYSHEECIKATAALGWPWPNHTLPGAEPRVWECNYLFGLPTNLDSHGREFGAKFPGDSARTDQAVRAVYAELVARSGQREGVYQPISLDTPLQGITDSLTLDESLSHFVHDWNFDQPAERRKYADQLAAAILAQREPLQPETPPALPPTGASGIGLRWMGLLVAGLALLAAGLLLRRRRVLR